MDIQKHGIPALLSFFVPGLGQITKGQIWKAIYVWLEIMCAIYLIPHILAAFIGYMELNKFLIISFAILFPILGAIWVWQIYDAYNN